MKLDKEFKSAINKEFKEADYVGKKFIIRVIIVGLLLIILCGFGGIGYKLSIGKMSKDADRQIFKESVAYNEQASSFLADSYKQYNEAETEADKTTIEQYVIMKYPNLDDDTIENETLRQFYNNCLN